ncbi:MAG: hypothetical protein ACE5GD_03830 [Candidatus Geothermarchaeales archaeon]
MRRESVRELINRLGGRFSVELGIDLSGGDSAEVFKWFIASILFGARISETIAANTYHEFVRNNLLDAKRILEVGWDGLVRVLDRGGYVRYDFKTADKFLEVMKNLSERYGGDLNALHEAASDPRDVENRIKDLGRGIGDVTANIFLRELREVWDKASPHPQSLIIAAARNLGFTTLSGVNEEERRQILEDLEGVWRKNKVPGRGFADFEAALLRLGKDFCRRARCGKCPLKEHCSAL